MGARLLPLSVAELCAHAIEIERDAAQRCKEYAARMRELGEDAAAASFEAMFREELQEIAALEAATGPRKPAELSPWEYAWRLAYTPDALENKPRLVPLHVREALQLFVLARRRAETLYSDVAENGCEPIARGCAAEMVARKKRQLRRLERMLAEETLNEQRSPRKGDVRQA